MNLKSETVDSFNNEDDFKKGFLFSCKYIGTVGIDRPINKHEIVMNMRQTRAEFKRCSIKKRCVDMKIALDAVDIYLSAKKRKSNFSPPKNNIFTPKKNMSPKDYLCQKIMNGDPLLHHSINRIFYVSHDSRDTQIFSYITREDVPPYQFKCSLFKAYKKAEATRIVRTIGKVFSICHERNEKINKLNQDTLANCTEEMNNINNNLSWIPLNHNFDVQDDSSHKYDSPKILELKQMNEICLEQKTKDCSKLENFIPKEIIEGEQITGNAYFEEQHSHNYSYSISEHIKKLKKDEELVEPKSEMILFLGYLLAFSKKIDEELKEKKKMKKEIAELKNQNDNLSKVVERLSSIITLHISNQLRLKCENKYSPDSGLSQTPPSISPNHSFKNKPIDEYYNSNNLHSKIGLFKPSDSCLCEPIFSSNDSFNRKQYLENYSFSIAGCSTLPSKDYYQINNGSNLNSGIICQDSLNIIKDKLKHINLNENDDIPMQNTFQSLIKSNPNCNKKQQKNKLEKTDNISYSPNASLNSEEAGNVVELDNTFDIVNLAGIKKSIRSEILNDKAKVDNKEYDLNNQSGINLENEKIKQVINVSKYKYFERLRQISDSETRLDLSFDDL